MPVFLSRRQLLAALRGNCCLVSTRFLKALGPAISISIKARNTRRSLFNYQLGLLNVLRIVCIGMKIANKYTLSPTKMQFMKFVVLVFLMAGSVAVFSQDKKGFTPYMMHGIGASFQDFDALNARVGNFSQYKQLKDHMGTLQLGWLKEYNRIISAWAFQLGSSMSGDRDKKSSNVRFFGFSADLGYNVLSSDRIMLYPMVGIGYEKYQARFFKDNSVVDFDDVLESPTVQNNIRPVDFKNSFLTYRAGAGFAIKSAKNPYHAIGLHAGYTGSFRDRKWRSDQNQELMNSPEEGLGRVFVSLTFLSQPRFMKHHNKEKEKSTY